MDLHITAFSDELWVLFWTLFAVGIVVARIRSLIRRKGGRNKCR